MKNKLCLNIHGKLIPPSEHAKLLGVTIDNALKFDTNVHGMCTKADQNINTFGRLRSYLGKDESKLLLNAVILSNLSYCSLIWLFCSITASNEINRTHKRASRILSRDYESKFEGLLDRDNAKETNTKNKKN